MNRIERLTAILLLLQEKPRTSMEIAQHFEVSKRTVLRDVQALCEMGVPVIAREGPGGGYALPDGYRLAPLPLTGHEAFLLLLALGAITRLSDAPFAANRASLAAKLRALVTEEQLQGVEELLATVGVDVPERSQRAPFLEALIAAARERQWVRVSYQSAERLSTQHLLPRQLSTHNGFWYCQAYAHEAGEERTYRVDRIRALEPAPPEFRPAPPPEPRPYGHESHPRVVATLTPRGVSYVESEPHLGQLIRSQPDGSGQLDLRCPPGELDWYARYFAGLGQEVEVHAPPELCERLARLGQKLVERYQKG
ncbi:MAG TPA: WYL domain-containing protein [Ardenticatenaceae bacterium]|nr:WYL domain-containing protein [Ardenticatenaceae bacterium]